MNKSKIINICLLVLLVILLVLCFVKIKHFQELRQKNILAQEIHQGLQYLMLDLAQARESSMVGVPPDGQWHDRVGFDSSGHGMLVYEARDGHLVRISGGKALLLADSIQEFHIRRLDIQSHLVEIQIKAKRDVSLEFNLKIRIFH